MNKEKYEPVPHDHQKFLEQARKKKGFADAYDSLEDEYALLRQMLGARVQAGLTQDTVAQKMGTTKSAISRLESGSRHSPSLNTLRRYAEAVGCRVVIKLVAEKKSGT